MQEINKEALQRRDNALREIEQYRKNELEKTESDALNETFELIQRETAQIRNKINHDTQKLQNEQRQKLLQKREEITRQVFELCERELERFVKTPAYLEFLEKRAKEAKKYFKNEDTVFYLKEQDMIYCDKIRAAFGKGCTFETDNDIKLGGMKIYSPSQRILADETLTERLYSQKKWFIRHCGLSV